MKVVYKYELQIPEGPPGSLGLMYLPKDAEVLKIDTQDDNYFVWCLVDPLEMGTTRHRFMVVGTGHKFVFPPEANLKYQDTVITCNGRLVLHFWMEQV